MVLYLMYIICSDTNTQGKYVAICQLFNQIK